MSATLLLSSEVFVDWVKHAFITKFNCISSEVRVTRQRHPSFYRTTFTVRRIFLPGEIQHLYLSPGVQRIQRTAGRWRNNQSIDWTECTRPWIKVAFNVTSFDNLLHIFPGYFWTFWFGIAASRFYSLASGMFGMCFIDIIPFLETQNTSFSIPGVPRDESVY